MLLRARKLKSSFFFSFVFLFKMNVRRIQRFLQQFLIFSKELVNVNYQNVKFKNQAFHFFFFLFSHDYDATSHST